MLLCVDHGSLNQADRVMQSNANLTNTGSVPLCNVTIKVREERRSLIHTIEERGRGYHTCNRKREREGGGLDRIT
jgi:hypothetical protein